MRLCIILVALALVSSGCSGYASSGRVADLEERVTDLEASNREATLPPTRVMLLPPSPVSKEYVVSGICGRSPRMQDIIMEALGTYSCGAISPGELNRITELNVSGQLKEGDLDGFANLEVLGVYTDVPQALHLPALRALSVQHSNLPCQPVTLNGETLQVSSRGIGTEPRCYLAWGDWE